MACGLVLLIGAIVATPTRDSAAQTLPVRPILECVVENGPGDYTAHFGYLNENPSVVAIPIGSGNKFTPAPEDRGQPTNFQPGRTPFYPQSAFQVDFDGANLVWTLRSPNGSTRTSTASANSSRCPTPPATTVKYLACYRASKQILEPSPPTVKNQSVDDWFESRFVDIRATTTVCTPAAVTANGTLNPILDPATYAVGRKIGLTATRPVQPPFRATDPSHQITVEDVFGPHRITLLAYDRTLLPSAVCNPQTATCSGQPSDLPLTGLSTDELKCYRVRPQTGEPVVQRNIVGSDAFQDRVYTIKQPRMFCTRASRGGSDPTAPTDPKSLLCYRIRPAFFYCEPGAPPPYGLAPCVRDAQCGGSQCILAQRPSFHRQIDGLFVNNALAAQRLHTYNEDVMCMPAQILP